MKKNVYLMALLIVLAECQLNKKKFPLMKETMVSRLQQN